MRRGLRLSVSNDGFGAGAGAGAAAVVVDGDGGDEGVDDEVTPGPEGGVRPPAPRHIAVRRSLRAARRRWRRLTPVQRLVLVAAAVFVCMAALRLGGHHHGAEGGADLPVASLAAVKEQQKQQQQQQRPQQQQAKQQPRRKAQAGARAGAGAAGAKRREAPEPPATAAAEAAAAADPTPPAPAKTAAADAAKPPAKATTATAVGAGGKQDKSVAASSPLAGRKRRKGGRKAKAGAGEAGAGGAGGSTKAKKKASGSSSASTSTTKREAAAAPPADANAASTSATSKSSSKGEPAAEGEPADAAAAPPAAGGGGVAEGGDGEGKKRSLADLVVDGDALPGAVGEDATGAGAAPELDAEAEEEEEDAGEEAKEAAPAAAIVAPALPPQQQKKLVSGEETELPKLFYCLPNGGFNDICVETWWCIDYARRTGRALVWGYHNYIPQVAPYDPYFTLRPIENVTQYTQAEAAAFLYAERARRKAQGRFRRIRIHPRRLKIDFLLGEDEVAKARKAQGNPLFLNAPGMPQFAFNFSIPHAKADVVVFHKIGNRGSGMDTLRHLQFSEEVKRTFLSRWAQLSQPYIGLHVRSTDRSCPREKIERLLKHTRNLQRSRALKGADVYLATDNPEDSEEFLLELRDQQQRGIKSFTFIPAENEDGERVPLHLNRNLQPAEKHQTHVDGFVDLLLLAFCDHFIKTCGGYGRLAAHLHQDKRVALSLIGEALEEGQEVNDVLAAAAARLGLGGKAAAAAAKDS